MTFRAAAIGVAAAILAGCGSGDGSGGVGTIRSAGGGPSPLLARTVETIESGHTTGYPLTGPDEALILDAGSFATLYAVHAPQGAAPAVDFATRGVIAAFLGPQGLGEPQIAVIAASEDPRTRDLHVTLRRKMPANWLRYAAVATSPYAFATVEASGLSGRIQARRQQELEFEVLGTGRDAAVADEIHVCRSQADYDAAFARIAPGQTPPQGAIAPIDFSREQVIAVVAPVQPDTLHDVVVRRVIHDEAADEIRVLFDVERRPTGVRPPPGPETPYAILRTNATTGKIRAERAADLPRKIVDAGAQSTHHGPARTFVVRDDATLQSAWAAIGGTPPAVDFAKEQLVVAFAGNALATYDAIAPGTIRALEDGEVDVELRTIAKTSGGAGPLDSPYVAVSMPRTHGPVTFRFVDATPVP